MSYQIKAITNNNSNDALTEDPQYTPNTSRSMTAVTNSFPSKRKPEVPTEALTSNKSRKTSADATPQHIVADHYNNIEDKGRQRRNESKIIFLRNFNNWVKSILISENISPQGVVLDMGCGKGGDLLKWSKARISKLVGLGTRIFLFFFT